MSELVSILDVLERWAVSNPHGAAYRFLSDRGMAEIELSFAALYRRATALGAELTARSGQPGDRALLVFPPGLDFVIAFFGCLFAGIIAVPMMPPRRVGFRDASASILADCAPRFALTGEKFATAIRADVTARPGSGVLQWLIVGGEEPPSPADIRVAERSGGNGVALLQYTSGSTSAPKGVMVTHLNLLENLEMITRAFGNTQHSNFVNWMPLHHDMGLVMNCLAALYVGATCNFMSPTSFLQRPLSWLRAIFAHKAEVAGGPNFAFDHCVSRFRPDQMEGIDLSGWRVAFNGAEPVHPDTLARFASTFAPYGFEASALYPCYGMAEATVLISGSERGRGAVIRAVSRKAMQSGRAAAPADDTDAHQIVGCGHALGQEQIAIVEPERRQRLGSGEVGEIWVCGAHVGRGYWKNEEASCTAFAAAIVGETTGPWLRTGDLGFLSETGQLFVTGRIKDVIIVRGVNHYPQDIEQTVQASSTVFRPGHGAAFAIPDVNSRERVVIVQEIERTQRHDIDPEELRGAAREAVVERHELFIHEIVLLKPGSIPKTTSGKIQRRLTCQLWQEGRLDVAMIENRSRHPARPHVAQRTE